MCTPSPKLLPGEETTFRTPSSPKVCLWAWRKLEQKLPGNQGTRMIAVKESMMIAPGLRLAVIEFEGRKLLVSVGRGGVSLVDRGETPHV